MQDKLTTEVLVIGEGCAGQAAALAAAEAGCDVLLLGDGRPPSTAISTGFLTFAAHAGFDRAQLRQAMAEVTGKGLCDRALLDRLVNAAPEEMAGAIAAYGIPVDEVERGLRARRALGRTGSDLLPGDEAAKGAADMTGLMMEFSSTHGTALYAQLRKAVTAQPRITRLRGSAITLEAGDLAIGALLRGQPLLIAPRAVILATGGLQGLYAFTDTPETLVGDGHAMAAEAGAEFVDLEFIQFYPLAVQEPGVPPIFLYPDFPRRSTLMNGRGENVLAKHLGPGAQYLADLHNWDQLSALIQAEIIAGQDVLVDFRETTPADWALDSLTGTFLAKFIPDFRTRPVRVAPSSHYTIGGLRVDVHGRTSMPGVYAAGEVAGGVHGANRHGGTALVEAITFGRIAARHAAESLAARSSTAQAPPLPPDRQAGQVMDPQEALQSLRRLNQKALGPIRDAVGLADAALRHAALDDVACSAGWEGFAAMQEVLRLRRGIRLSSGLRAAMERRTETRGTHARADHPQSRPEWLRKQVVTLAGQTPCITDAAL